MNIKNRIKMAVGLNLLYFIFVFLEITLISLLSYFLFLSLIFFTAHNSLNKSARIALRKNSSQPLEFISRDKVECFFKMIYSHLNRMLSYFYSSTSLRNLQKLIFVGGCLVGLIFLSSIFSDLSVVWLLGNIYLIWPVVSHKFEPQMNEGMKIARAKFQVMKYRVIAMIPKFSDLDKED